MLANFDNVTLRVSIMTQAILMFKFSINKVYIGHKSLINTGSCLAAGLPIMWAEIPAP
jgi:hypothetical protein